MNSDNSDNIILSFPVLKELVSYGTQWWGAQSVNFEVPLLQRLETDQRESGQFECSNVNYNFTSNPFVIISRDLFELDWFFSEEEEEKMEVGLRACIFLRQINVHEVKHLELSSTMVRIYIIHAFHLHYLKLNNSCKNICFCNRLLSLLRNHLMIFQLSLCFAVLS